jgi:hypothetical protein
VTSRRGRSDSPGPTPAALCRNPHLADRRSTYSAIRLTHVSRTRGRRQHPYSPAVPLLPPPGWGLATQPPRPFLSPLFTKWREWAFPEVRRALESASSMPLTKLGIYAFRLVYSGEPTPPVQGAPGSGFCGPWL